MGVTSIKFDSDSDWWRSAVFLKTNLLFFKLIIYCLRQSGFYFVAVIITDFLSICCNALLESFSESNWAGWTSHFSSENKGVRSLCRCRFFGPWWTLWYILSCFSITFNSIFIQFRYHIFSVIRFYTTRNPFDGKEEALACVLLSIETWQWCTII
jgi:hypothetical protein